MSSSLRWRTNCICLLVLKWKGFNSGKKTFSSEKSSIWFDHECLILNMKPINRNMKPNLVSCQLSFGYLLSPVIPSDEKFLFSWNWMEKCQCENVFVHRLNFHFPNNIFRLRTNSVREKYYLEKSVAIPIDPIFDVN